MRSRICCGAFALALGPPPADEPPSFSLEWDAPAECPSSAAFMSLLESLLGRSLAPPLGEGMQVRAHATQSADGWKVSLRVQTPQGERVRDLPAAKTCSEATNAAALVVAIAIDPDVVTLPEPPGSEPVHRSGPADAGTSGPEPEPEPEPESESKSESESEPLPVAVEPDVSEPPPPPPPPAPRRASIPVRGFAGLGALVGLGGLPNVGAGFGLSAGIFSARTNKLVGFRVAVDGRYWLARTVGVANADVIFRQWTVGALAGPTFRLPLNFEVAPMAGFEGGQVIVRDRGLPASGPEVPPAGGPDLWAVSDPWAAARLRLQAAWAPIRWVAPWLGVEMMVPMRRARFLVDGAGEVHQAAPLGVRGVLGLEARFP